MTNQGKVLLIILDGWGLDQDSPGNAINQAKTPFYDQLWQNYPTAVLECAGESVGLPQGQMGTSEVNHFTIGAGKVVFQDLVRINKAIADRSFFENPELLASFDHVKKHDSTLHIVGLLSDGGVHSHIDHFLATLEAAAQSGIKRVVVHPITDGRDTSPTAGQSYLQTLQDAIEKLPVGAVATVGGRYFAMDRDTNWDRTDQYFNLLTGRSNEAKHFSSAEKAIEASYTQEVTDEFVQPCYIDLPGGERQTVTDHDAVIMINFRVDRPRQLVQRFLDNGPDIRLVTMTQYSQEFNLPVLFEPEPHPISLGEILSEHKLKQLRITETEKFPHVTYYFNCKNESVFEGEDRTMYDSYSDIPTHDHKPYMRTPDIAQGIIDAIETNSYDVIISNICNADMVGHTGNIPAAIEGCETVDAALARIIPVAEENGWHVLITADHGNAEVMIDEETEKPMTSHTTNPVPLIFVSPTVQKLPRKSGTLVDLAPTILDLLALPTPDTMTGESFVATY